MDYYDKLRKLLKKRRIELNMMQTEVAEKADISNNFYSNIERGNTKPSVETVFKICKALNLSLDKIIFEEDVPIEENFIKEATRDLKSIARNNDKKSIQNTIELCNIFSNLLDKMQ